MVISEKEFTLNQAIIAAGLGFAFPLSDKPITPVTPARSAAAAREERAEPDAVARPYVAEKACTKKASVSQADPVSGRPKGKLRQNIIASSILLAGMGAIGVIVYAFQSESGGQSSIASLHKKTGSIQRESIYSAPVAALPTQIRLNEAAPPELAPTAPSPSLAISTPPEQPVVAAPIEPLIIEPLIKASDIKPLVPASVEPPPAKVAINIIKPIPVQAKPADKSVAPAAKTMTKITAVKPVTPAINAADHKQIF